MEFMDGDGEIEVNAYAKENSLYIDVTDNGMGIPEEEIDGLLKRDNKHRAKRKWHRTKNVHEKNTALFWRKIMV